MVYLVVRIVARGGGNRHTDTQTKLSTVTLAAHARRGLIKYIRMCIVYAPLSMCIPTHGYVEHTRDFDSYWRYIASISAEGKLGRSGISLVRVRAVLCMLV